jgi:hypothetical protein
MVLTKEDRIELLKKARLAKANKRAIKEEEEEDMEDEDTTPVVNVPLPTPEIEPPTPKKKTGRKPKEVVPLPVPVEVVQIEEELPVPKKKVVPNPKWLKQPKTEPEKVCCDKKLTKEEPVIDEKPQVVAETIVVPPQKEIKKVRKIRASTPAKTLDLTDKPRDIVDVIEELKMDNDRHLPKVVKPVATASAPISIVRVEQPLRLFDY